MAFTGSMSIKEKDQHHTFNMKALITKTLLQDKKKKQPK